LSSGLFSRIACFSSSTWLRFSKIFFKRFTVPS
jgi:hypothetical protein